MTFENIKKGDIISYVYSSDYDRVFVDTMEIGEIKANTQGGIVITTVVLNTTNTDFPQLMGHHDIFSIPSEAKNSTEYGNLLLSIDSNDIQLKKKKIVSELFICHNRHFRQLKKRNDLWLKVKTSMN